MHEQTGSERWRTTTGVKNDGSSTMPLKKEQQMKDGGRDRGLFFLPATC
jgi:hypothetical protein